ncbi:MAG TPA: cryptochrome/photolyase family protein [Proteiniclasticum sp.]|nr:cryptochrome/photolyase family protein [Proteiniclasticum sp.]
MKTLWVLENQLNENLDGFKQINQKSDVVLFMESKDRALWKGEHKQKLVLVFSAMRHFAAELEDKGYEVDYRIVDNYSEGLKAHLAIYSSEKFLVHEPTDHRIRTMIENELFSSGKVKTEILSERPLFLVEKKDWEIYLPQGEMWKQDQVYRRLRKERGILMEKGRPIGGKWTFDSENRKSPTKGLTFSEPIQFPPDKITLEVMNQVEKEYPNHFGELKNFSWPVTRGNALEALDQFIEHRLVTFGEYQDAMMQGKPWMSHSLISGAMNMGLLTPEEVIEKAEEAYHQKKASLSSVEGFIRQILGWREYIRGVYLRRMPEYEKVNCFDHQNPLPSYYWTGKTDMNCLSTVVKEVIENGYSHHIERLMVLGNWANLLRVRPQEVSDWFLEAYVDAYDWVVLPNVLGMALYADGGLMSTKPYVSSGQYINRMSDYCESCDYSISEKTGDKACPFNALYWLFLEDHRDPLEKNPRMRLMYANWDKQKEEQKIEIITKGRTLLDEAKMATRNK